MTFLARTGCPGGSADKQLSDFIPGCNSADIFGISSGAWRSLIPGIIPKQPIDSKSDELVDRLATIINHSVPMGFIRLGFHEVKAVVGHFDPA